MTEPAAPTRSVVVKVGGREIRPGPALEALARRIGLYAGRGLAPVLVHGGGEEITDRAEALGLRTSKLAGQRVTSAPMLEIVIEVLAGRINGRLTAALGRAGVGAIGLTGASDGLLAVRPAGDPPGTLGFVGIPDSVRPRALRALRSAGFVPVLAPIGVDRAGQLFNVNADLAAGAVASALGSDLWLLTDVPGVLDRAGRVAHELPPGRARRWLEEGTVTDGMIPKLQAAVRALLEGAPAAWIGRPESLGAEGPLPGAGTWVRGAARAAPLTSRRAIPAISAPGGP
ncbi:MAG: acetylglutamate kinase [Thermoplasmata archaeon]